MIQYIGYVDPSNGEIVRIQFAQGTVPPAGPDAETGLHIVHFVDEDITMELTDYIETHWYDIAGDVFLTRERRPNGHAIWNSGGYWQWDEDAFLEDVRRIRNQKLLTTDWSQLDDADLTPQRKADYRVYRQRLRDFTLPIKANPTAYSKLEELVWPVEPV